MERAGDAFLTTGKMNFFKSLFSKTTPQSMAYPSEILTLEAANLKLTQYLENPDPFMACRIGGVEFSCLTVYLKQISAQHPKFKKGIRDQMHNNAGFFPATHPLLTQFCREMLENVSHTDMIGVWNKPQEPYVFSTYCPHTNLAPLSVFDAFSFEDPWSKRLEGKRVLVIHPFAQTIEKQFKYRDKLFKNPLTLPPFELITLPAVQSIAGTQTPYQDWFSALKSMTDQIKILEFDVALIGAGAYGLPLAGFIKKMGKKSIHMGGNLQILFGIKGKRWEEHLNISRFYNEYWTRPSLEETPPKFRKVEGGTYW